MKFILALIFSSSIGASFASQTIQQKIQLLHKQGNLASFKEIDAMLGIRYDETEKTIPSILYPTSVTVRWDKNSTQTDYDIIHLLFANHSPGTNDVFYDLGSGYGRVLFYGASLFPKTKFIGVELVPERVAETKRMAQTGNFSNVSFIEQDVLKTDLSQGTIFYMYNPFPEIMPQVLEKLRAVSIKHKILIIGHLRTAGELKGVQWLRLIKHYHPQGLAIFESR